MENIFYNVNERPSDVRSVTYHARKNPAVEENCNFLKHVWMVVLVIACLLVSGFTQAEDKGVKWAVEKPSERGGEIPIGSMVRIKVQGKTIGSVNN